MTKTGQLNHVALEGYNAAMATGYGCPYLATSVHADAWVIGRWLFQRHLTEPRDIRKSRGDTYHVNGMKVRLNYIQGCTEIERIG